MQRILSFDIELSNIFDLKPGEDLDIYAPFQISVAATAYHNGDSKPWFSRSKSGRYFESISQKRARALLAYLDQETDEGTMVCAWNGLSFDLRWIGHNADDMELAAKVALRIYDPMFQFFNLRCHMVGVAAVADGMRLQQKKLMHGSEAPQKWKDGHHQEVIDYVIGDCQLTNSIVASIQEKGYVRWITKKGEPCIQKMPKLMTVQEVINTPQAPVPSWMDNPKPKASFYDWFPPSIKAQV